MPGYDKHQIISSMQIEKDTTEVGIRGLEFYC